MAAAVRRVTNASKRVRKSIVAHKWAWPTSGQIGYRTTDILGVPNASKQGRKSEVAHKWVQWLHNPGCLGGPKGFRVVEKIGSGPQVRVRWRGCRKNCLPRDSYTLATQAPQAPQGRVNPLKL